ncbi:diguanylate phosphodiesterase [Shewanella halifaxensis HAW-EB4]|uniref:Diguanylate phosphodiesterase n=1 Tax=Shewanella halifaxensis (strain HAW-EB4) TaxID=458817 RepID=B0TK60_SHEHH|nr:EAL domain-containing protein [Shewanella halifaxensis]ABZ77079.1 diguanylate phosphodiesterase [Shewanella halifaxensis HAW-EB4]
MGLGCIPAAIKNLIATVDNYSTRISRFTIINALVSSSIMLMPIAIFRAIIQIVAVIAELNAQTWLAQFLYGMSDVILEVLPLLFCVVISYVHSTYLRISGIMCLICSLVFIAVVNYILNGSPSIIDFNLFITVMVTALCSYTIKWCTRFKTSSDISNEIVDRGILQLIQFSLVFAIAVIFSYALMAVQAVIEDLTLSFEASVIPHDYLSGLLYEFTRNICWFFGFHSYHLVGNLGLEFQALSTERIALINSGSTPDSFLTYQFMDIYSAIGGSGSTLSLIVAVLFFSKSRSHRNLAKVSTPFSILNINEPIIYGMPIIFNIWLIVPFILVPLINFSLAYGLTAAEIIPPLTENVNWMLPAVYNVWLASDGDIVASMLQLAMILLGALIYKPFLDRYGAEHIPRANLDKINQTDLAGKFSDYRDVISEQNQAKKTIKQIMDGGEFILYLQPQFDLKQNAINGGEILLRYRDDRGEISPPYFLDLFERVGVISDIDYIVITQVSELVDTHALPQDFKVSINISPSSFCSEQILSELILLSQKMATKGLKLVVEITENQQWEKEQAYNKIFERLQSHNILIALDDFGTGYSNVANVLGFAFDYIKLDMSLASHEMLIKNPNVIKGLMLIAESGGAQIIAEGVEIKEQVDILTQSNIYTFQGYYYARPMPIDEFLQSANSHATASIHASPISTTEQTL